MLPQVSDELTGLLRRFTGDLGVPRPDRMVRDKWSTDPDSLCSLSYPMLTTEEADFDTLSSPLPSEADPRLLFCGEATNRAYFGTMHGARLSGLREARRILDRMEVMDKMAEELEKISGSKNDGGGLNNDWSAAMTKLKRNGGRAAAVAPATAAAARFS